MSEKTEAFLTTKVFGVRLQTELDSLEVQIEQVNASKAKMSAKMQAAMTARTDSLQSKIRVLRRALAKGKLTSKELGTLARDAIL